MSYYKVCPDCGAHLDAGEFCDCQFTVNVTLRVGPVPYIGCTMTDDREKEIARSSALRNMHKFGLESCVENLPEYFRRAQEVLA